MEFVLKHKIDSEEKQVNSETIQGEWLDDNQSAEIEEQDDKIKELEALYNPIINKAY